MRRDILQAARAAELHRESARHEARRPRRGALLGIARRVPVRPEGVADPRRICTCSVVAARRAARRYLVALALQAVSRGEGPTRAAPRTRTRLARRRVRNAPRTTRRPVDRAAARSSSASRPRRGARPATPASGSSCRARDAARRAAVRRSALHSSRASTDEIAPRLAPRPARALGSSRRLDGRFVAPGPRALPRAVGSTCFPPAATSTRSTCARSPRPRPSGWRSAPPSCSCSGTFRITASTRARLLSRSGARPPCERAATTSRRRSRCSACARSGPRAAAASSTPRSCPPRRCGARASTWCCASLASFATRSPISCA